MKYAVLFIALLFAGCGEATPTLDGGETITISGKTIQVAKEDFPEDMNWDDAMNACQNLGNGWRLPSIEELKVMCEQLHMKGEGNFKDKSYWSSSESFIEGDPHLAWIIEFRKGKEGRARDLYKFNSSGTRVRAVRALP